MKVLYLDIEYTTMLDTGDLNMNIFTLTDGKRYCICNMINGILNNVCLISSYNSPKEATTFTDAYSILYRFIGDNDIYLKAQPIYSIPSAYRDLYYKDLVRIKRLITDVMKPEYTVYLNRKEK